MIYFEPFFWVKYDSQASGILVLFPASSSSQEISPTSENNTRLEEALKSLKI